MNHETAIIKNEEADLAFSLFKQLVEAKRILGANFLLIGAILTKIKEEKLYRYFDCDTFREFLAMPELGFAWQTSMLFMHVFDLYIRRLKCDQERIANIPISNLQVIAPVVEHDVEGWLSLAENASRSDLINACREYRGLDPMKPKRNVESERILLVSFDEYKEFVSANPCCVCGAQKADVHHFPRTVGAGAEDFKVIPLCRKCHTEYHNDPHKFLIDNEERIFNYFYDVIQEAYSIISGR